MESIVTSAQAELCLEQSNGRDRCDGDDLQEDAGGLTYTVASAAKLGEVNSFTLNGTVYKNYRNVKTHDDTNAEAVDCVVFSSDAVSGGDAREYADWRRNAP